MTELIPDIGSLIDVDVFSTTKLTQMARNMPVWDGQKRLFLHFLGQSPSGIPCSWPIDVVRLLPIPRGDDDEPGLTVPSTLESPRGHVAH